MTLFRLNSLIAAVGSLPLLLGSFAFQHIGGLAPCPLCLLQRWPHAAAILIGAPAYFGEIGFTVTPKHQLIFPGPQDPARVMVKSLAGDASQLSGRVTAA